MERFGLKRARRGRPELPDMQERERVLIVDDEEAVRRSLSFMLEKEGFPTVSAASAAGAIEALREGRFGVVLMDNRLPDATGTDLVEPLKEVQPDIDVIIITGFATMESALAALDQGVAGYITKPLDLRKMVDKLSQVLQRRRLVRRSSELFEAARRELVERKQAEQALRESEERYRNLVELSQDAIFVVQESRIVFANPAAARLLEAEKPGDLADAEIMEFIHEDYRDRVRQRMRNAAAGASNPPAEFKITTRKRALRVVESVSNPTTFGGRPALQAIVRDLTERNRAEAALAESEERFVSFMRHVPGAAYIKDEHGRLLYLNRGAGDALGVDPASLEGKTDFELWPRELAERFRNEDRQVIETGREVKSEDEAEIGGEKRVFLTRRFPIYRGDKPPLVGVLQIDITERKRAEEALAESKELLERLFDNTHVLIAYLDSDLNFIRVNRAYAAAGGHPPDFFTGKNHFDLYPHAENENIFRRVVETGRPYFAYEKPFVYPDRPDLTTYWDWSLEPIKDGEGNVRELVLILLNVTERKHVQQELRSLASQLSLAEESERRRISVALHDYIGQSLSLSQIMLGALKEAAPSEEFSRKVEEVRKLIDGSLQDTRALIFDLSPPILYEVGLEAAIERLAEEMQDRHRFKCIFRDDGRAKRVDPTTRIFLFQAARELLLNASRHSEAGEVRIEIGRDQDFVRLTVSDNGTGFDASEAALKIHDNGGFGLFNIRERVESLGGRFELVSRRGRGTTCTLMAPISGSGE